MATSSSFTVSAITASAFNTGFPPEYSADGKLDSWWSVNGVGQWIRYDLGEAHTLQGVQLAFYRGDLRKASFDVEVSQDGTSWTKVLSNIQTSGTTLDLETYAFPLTSGRYVRVTNLGNTENIAIGLTEARFVAAQAASITGVAASASLKNRTPQHSFDRDLSSYWAAKGKGAWIQYDAGALLNLDNISLAFYRGNLRTATFDVDVSPDGSNWIKVLSSARSSGNSLAEQRFAFKTVNARYLRVTNLGNSEDNHAAYTEASFTTPLVSTVTVLAPAEPTATSSSPYSKAYYVDCVKGSDSNSGSSETSAWQSLGKANAASLNPGEALLFKRGCSWDGQLTAQWQGTAAAPVTIGSYGSGELPRVRTTGTQEVAIAVTGTYQVLEYLEPVVGNRPSSWIAKNSWYTGTVKCPTQSQGWRIGFSLRNSNNVVRYVKGSGFTAAIHFSAGTNNKALHNTLTNNDIVSTNTPPDVKYDDDSGAWGVLLNASGNEVAHNTFGGNLGCSEDYGTEGASVEIYKGSDNYVHHNISVNDGTFTELGGTSTARAERNTFAYNLFAPMDALSQDAGEFLVVRGWNSSWGANPGTKAYNNTAYNVQVGVACFDGCGSDILDFRNNIVIGAQNPRKSEYWTDSYNGTSATESNNRIGRIGGSPSFSTPAGRSSTTRLLTSGETNALFVSPQNHDFALSSTSLAVNAGLLWPLTNLAIATDLAGKMTPVSTEPDAGAYERQY
ncbi:discoidin domain-containing protein [Deinococcus peraridilitoris]|nr:discoidin domain-containing protein [Deinococcus peraridilitoris]